MSSALTTSWLKFFRDAGIQNTTSAALYATTFAENELTEDMVGDLTREILKEMGITLMGHVLAILKHARTVHQEAQNNRIVAKTTYPSVKGIVSPFPVTPPEELRPRKGTISKPAQRIIEHYVQRPADPPREPTPPPLQLKTVRVGGVRKTSDEPPVASKLKSKLKVTDRLGILKSPVHHGIQKTVISAIRNEEVVPVRRNRRVLPEQEGSYKITMPLGTTPKTKKILDKQQTYGRTKTTVFQRLGGSDSSAESEERDRKVTITEPTHRTSNRTEPTVKTGGSVFSRLGGRNEVTSTVTSATAEPSVQARLGYRGVLKSPPSTSAASSSTIRPSAKLRLGQSTVIASSRSRAADSSQSPKHSSVPATLTTKKKYVLVKKSGERKIVYRDVPQAVPAPQQRTTFDAATRNKFRSDNIAVVSGISSRLGMEMEEEEWDY